MAEVTVTRTLDATPDALWKLVSDFGDLSWLPGGGAAAEFEGSGPGMVRVLVGPNGKIREQLESVDEAARSLTYTIPVGVPFPVTDYRATDDGIAGITVTTLDDDEQSVDCDALLVFWGLAPKLGPIADWGLDLNRKTVNVDTEKFETNIPGIYAIGDINYYPGKKKLILSGFHEAALAAFAAKERLEPEKKAHLQYTTTSPLMHKRLGIED